MSHLIKIYAVCRFSYFCLLALKVLMVYSYCFLLGSWFIYSLQLSLPWIKASFAYNFHRAHCSCLYFIYNLIISLNLRLYYVSTTPCKTFLNKSSNSQFADVSCFLLLPFSCLTFITFYVKSKSIQIQPITLQEYIYRYMNTVSF